MSKMDGLRAMREARYQAAQGRAAQPARTKRPAPSVPAERVAAAVEDAAQDELCGHRNMSGRTCTRERGHAAKSHRYS